MVQKLITNTSHHPNHHHHLWCCNMSRILVSISILLNSLLSNATDHYCLIPTDLASLFTFFVAILFVVILGLQPSTLALIFVNLLDMDYQPQSSPYLYRYFWFVGRSCNCLAYCIYSFTGPYSVLE